MPTDVEVQPRNAAPFHVDQYEPPPDWVIAELPERHAEIAAQIAALQAQARSISTMSALLWQTGTPLVHAVCDAFAAIGFPAELAGQSAHYDVAVSLDRGRRLLLEVVGSPGAIDRTSPKITRVLQTIQLAASEQDRVVLVANAHCQIPVGERKSDPVTFDALKLIVGLGANFVTTSTLFAAWKYSLKDANGARKIVHNLYSLAGGMYK